MPDVTPAPLPLSVAILSDVLDSCSSDPEELRKVVDARVRPLVEALTQAKILLAEVIPSAGHAECERAEEVIDAALKAAGAE